MPTPHPLAAVALRMVREEPTRRGRSLRPGRRWFRRRNVADTEPLTSRAARPEGRTIDEVPAAPPGLALPPPLRLPRQRVSPEQAGSPHNTTVVRGA